MSVVYLSRAEALPLEWSRVDRTTRTIRLEPGATKNREGRTLPYGLLPELVDVIDTQWAAYERLRQAGTICPFVFHRDGKRIRDFRGAWETACTAARCPGRIPHDFRRTAVRNLVRAGVPEKTAMGITGHKTRSVFDRYDIVNAADLENALEKLDTWRRDEQARSDAADQSGTVETFTPRAASNR